MQFINGVFTRILGVWIIGFSSFSFSAERTWSGLGGDNEWGNAKNWEPEGQPGWGDILTVGAGAEPTHAGRSFKHLTVEKGASVTFKDDFCKENTIDVRGTIHKTGGILRLGNVAGGATMYLSGHLGKGIRWLDTCHATIYFSSGAKFDNPQMSFEQKGKNTFCFKLNRNGFDVLTMNLLAAGESESSSVATWEDVTYKIDISDFDLTCGRRFKLMEWSKFYRIGPEGFEKARVIFEKGDRTYDPELLYDAASQSFQVYFRDPAVWTGKLDTNWHRAGNWIPANRPPVADEKVVIPSGFAVTEAENQFAVLEIQKDAVVQLSTNVMEKAYGFIGEKGCKITVDGTLDAPAASKVKVLRLQKGTTLDLSGSIGSGINFFDTNGGTITFYDGAEFSNPSLVFQHKLDNTFAFVLSETGFKPIAARKLNTGDSHEGWANVTYQVDLTRYRGPRPHDFILMDFQAHDVDYNEPFQPERGSPKVEITGLKGGELRFERDQEKAKGAARLILHVKGNPGTILVLK